MLSQWQLEHWQSCCVGFDHELSNYFPNNLSQSLPSFRIKYSNWEIQKEFFSILYQNRAIHAHHVGLDFQKVSFFPHYITNTYCFFNKDHSHFQTFLYFWQSHLGHDVCIFQYWVIQVVPNSFFHAKMARQRSISNSRVSASSTVRLFSCADFCIRSLIDSVRKTRRRCVP